MTSQGQRFRRRAMRRGYKVDEVDSFLDRVEATLAGDPGGAPVTSSEVHDVVFRVRFGGYDEWQVDLHLDRVERQLAEQEEHAGGYGRESRPSERVPASDRISAPDRTGPAERPMGPPLRDERITPGAPPPAARAPMSAASMPPRTAGPPPGYDRRYDEPSPPGGYDEFEPGRHGKADMTGEMRIPDPTFGGGRPEATTYGNARSETTFGGGRPDADVRPEPTPYGGRPEPTPYGGRPEPTPYGGRPEPPTFGGGRSDTTFGGGGRSDAPAYGGGGRPDTSFGGGGGGGAGLTGEAQRVDRLRRTFQVRRFGSGYDREQVDRLFDGLVQAVAGRARGVSDAELDPSQFNLVPGGYFEAEVDAALKEVRDLLAGRR